MVLLTSRNYWELQTYIYIYIHAHTVASPFSVSYIDSAYQVTKMIVFLRLHHVSEQQPAAKLPERRCKTFCSLKQFEDLEPRQKQASLSFTAENKKLKLFTFIKLHIRENIEMKEQCSEAQCVLMPLI